MSTDVGRDLFLRNVNVSHETSARLDRYAELLALWQPKINLVGPKTIPELWSRHFLDSAQLLPLVTGAARLADLGSGGGFPGLVLAILTGCETHLVESDQRKAIFLREVSRETSAPVTVHTSRAETLEPLAADIVTARALAPLAELLPLAYRHIGPGGRAVFLKGAGWQAEVAAAREQGWMFHVKHFPSVTSAEAAILELSDIRPPA
jgi:16S rRNA (guanine527-N7)-methyltransferase